MIEEMLQELAQAGHLIGHNEGSPWVAVTLQDARGERRGPMQWMIYPGEEAGAVTLRRVLDGMIYQAPATVAGVLSEIEAQERALSVQLWPQAPEYHITRLERPTAPA